jgi:hypothetical protein
MHKHYYMNKHIRCAFSLSLALLITLASCSKKDSAEEKVLSNHLYPIKENGKWGYMDETGKVVVPPAYDYAWDYNDGMGRVKQKGKYGFLNEKGELVIKPEFGYADDFKEGFARINTKDTTVLDNLYDGYDLNAGWTFVDKKGVVFNQTFAKAEFLKTGLAQVKDDPAYDSPWTYAKLGNGTLEREDHNTDAIFAFNGHDLAPASDPANGKIGMINRKEEWIIQPTFDFMDSYSEGLAAANKDNIYGYVDGKGNWVYKQIISIKDYVYVATDFKPFTNGLAAVRFDKDSYGYITKDGKVAFKQRFKSAGSFSPEGYAIVTTDVGTALIDKDGNFAIKPHLDIVNASRGIAIFRQNNSFGAKEIKSGKDIVPARYDNVEMVGNLLRITNKGATFGFINRQGEFVIAPQFEGAWQYNQGKAIVQQREKYLYVDLSGKLIGEVAEKDQPYYYSNANTIYASNADGKFGFSKPDVDGLVIPASYDFATDFEGKVARVNIGASLNEETWSYEGGKWGLIDANGKLIIPVTYELILPFKNGVALFNSGGAATYSMCESECEESVFYSCNEGKWGLLGDDGKVLIEASYDQLIPFGENFLARTDGKFSLLDEQGKEIYPAQLELDTAMEEEGAIATKETSHFIKAKENGKFGVLDKDGKWMVEPKYDDISFATEQSITPFTEGALLAKEGEFWGAINASAEWIVTPAFQEMKQFSNNLAAVKKENVWGYINKSNEVVITPQFFAVRDFQGDVAIVQPKEDGTEGVINTKGDFVISPAPGVTFDYNGFVNGLCIINGTLKSETAGYPITMFGVVNSKGKVLFNKTALADARIQKDGLIYAYKNGKWAMANGQGAMLTGYVFDWIEPYTGQELIRCNIGGEFTYGEMGGPEEAWGGLWGFIDKNGSVKVPVKFGELGEFKEGLAPARTSEDLDLVGYINLDGKTIRDLKK